MDYFYPDYIKNILVTGGSGFIGSAVIRRLLTDTNAKIFNLDKMNYASDTKSIEEIIINNKINAGDRYQFLKVNLENYSSTCEAIEEANPEIVLHLAAETHVDRSIQKPDNFLKSNIVGTFNLLNGVLEHWKKISLNKKEIFRFLHVSTDEVFGSLDKSGFFSEDSNYAPRSPYSASKASSDHLVQAWHHTYGLPTIVTNCSNNYGPWQFPEKLIPNVILKAINKEQIPIYGNGLNIRDWLFVEDHVQAILLASIYGKVGDQYCIGGNQEKTNNEVVKAICEILDKKIPLEESYNKFICYVKDRPGHDKRYAIDSSKIRNSFGWEPRYDFSEGLEITINWYLKNIDWCKYMYEKSSYGGERIGVLD